MISGSQTDACWWKIWCNTKILDVTCSTCHHETFQHKIYAYQAFFKEKIREQFFFSLFFKLFYFKEKKKKKKGSDWKNTFFFFLVSFGKYQTIWDKDCHLDLILNRSLLVWTCDLLSSKLQGQACFFVLYFEHL